jgi:short-subunit dehydrogenase
VSRLFQVTIASILGHVGVAGVADYCGSKAAAILLHQSLKEELKAT